MPIVIACVIKEMIEFEVEIRWEKLGRFTSFPQAFALYYTKLNEAIAEGLPGGFLDTCTIDCFFDNQLMGPLTFDQIRDLADAMGLLVDGKLVELIREFDLRQTDKFYCLLAKELKDSNEALVAHIERMMARREEWERNHPAEAETDQTAEDQG